MTPNPNTHSDEEIRVRSLLMRLYHSRQVGEAFYHANLVNGEAPKLEADGWIERVGDGWRLTDVGLRQWAAMNTASFNSKYHYAGPFYKAMRDQLVQGEDEVNTCKKEGCDKPRMVSSAGKVQVYCEEHQREYWAAQKRASYVKPVKSAGQWVDGEPDTIKHEVVEDAHVINPAPTVTVVKAAEPLPVEHDCEQCEAKAVIEALRAKSPKLAKLIDAMQAEVEAARDLGI